MTSCAPRKVNEAVAARTNLKGRVPAQRPLQLSPNHVKALHPGLPSNPLGLREHIVAERGVEPGYIPGDTKGGALAWHCDFPEITQEPSWQALASRGVAEWI